MIKYIELEFPLTAQIEVTSNCNHGCIYCYNYWRNGTDIKYESNDELLLKAVSELGEGRVFEIVFTGGEPFLKRNCFGN